MFKSVLMVCVGNICRSPMAAGELSVRLRVRAPGVLVESAGLRALVGRPAEPMAQELMLARGFDLSSHRARQLTTELLRRFELVLVMEAAQRHAVEGLLPGARGRIHPIGRWGGFDVPDPYRRDRSAYERALELIARGVERYVNAFWPGPP